MANGNNNDYKLEFRSIDPARRWVKSRNDDTSFNYEYIHGLNFLGISVDNKIPELTSGFKEGNNKYTFLIKPYQRGFRWDAQSNVKKLFDDIFSYSAIEKAHCPSIAYLTALHSDGNEVVENYEHKDCFDFYCLQTLTVRAENGEWEVIDGQQRLTCILLIYCLLSAFLSDDIVYSMIRPYDIVYKRANGDGGGDRILLSDKIEQYIRESNEKIQKAKGIPIHKIFTMKRNHQPIDEWIEAFKKELVERINDDAQIVAQNIGSCSYLIDSYYIAEAMCILIDLISSKDNGDKKMDDMFDCVKRNVYFLWYEVPADDESDSGVETFLKINTGAIRLTDAELIKSLLLRKNKETKDEKISKNESVNETDDNAKTVKERSQQWERLEQGLSNTELWSFVAGNDKVTRMDLLLDIYARQESNDSIKYCGTTGNYELFDWYDEFLSQGSEDATPKKILDGIEDIYDRICEWYDDVEIYHYVGLLTVCLKLGFKFGKYENNEEMLKKLLDEAKDIKKSEFVRGLKQKIKSCILSAGARKPEIANSLVDLLSKVKDGNDSKKEELFLNYKDEAPRIEAILWLMNVYETIESPDNKNAKCVILRRFPFSQVFIDKKWSLEHIFPQNPDDATKEESEDYDKKFEEIKANLEKLKEECIERDEIHYIKNLVLLGQTENTTISNGMLGEKRKLLFRKIVGKNAFAPNSTLNAFMLYYNAPKDENVLPIKNEAAWSYWTKINAANYEKCIKDCLSKIDNAVEGKDNA